jgi:hypothetical protein
LVQGDKDQATSSTFRHPARAASPVRLNSPPPWLLGHWPAGRQSAQTKKRRRAVKPDAKGQAWERGGKDQASLVLRRSSRAASPGPANDLCDPAHTPLPRLHYDAALQPKKERPHHAEAKANHDICGNDGQNALWPTLPPMDRRSLGVSTGDSPGSCEAIGAMDARHRRDGRHSDRLSGCQFRRDRSFHLAAHPRAVDGRVRQPAPGVQVRGLIPVFGPSDASNGREWQQRASTAPLGQRRSNSSIALSCGR